MKTNELIKKVEILGYEITKKQFIDDTNYFVIYNSFGGTMCYVAINKLFEMKICLDEYMSEELFDLIVEYAKTPIEDREEKEKEFYLKHKWIKGCAIMYLYRNELNGYCYLGENKCRPHRQRMFTLEEIKELKEKFNTDLSDFEMVEVEE